MLLLMMRLSVDVFIVLSSEFDYFYINFCHNFVLILPDKSSFVQFFMDIISPRCTKTQRRNKFIILILFFLFLNFFIFQN